MTVWIKQGVRGRLNPQAQKCLGRIVAYYKSQGKDFFVTSIEEGTHSPGSLHYCGDAFDFRANGISIEEVRRIAGKNFDVVGGYATGHYHVEYDPK